MHSHDDDDDREGKFSGRQVYCDWAVNLMILHRLLGSVNIVINECVRNWKASQFSAPLVAGFLRAARRAASGFILLSYYRLFLGLQRHWEIRGKPRLPAGHPTQCLPVDSTTKLFHYPNHSTLKFTTKSKTKYFQAFVNC